MMSLSSAGAGRAHGHDEHPLRLFAPVSSAGTEDLAVDDADDQSRRDQRAPRPGQVTLWAERQVVVGQRGSRTPRMIPVPPKAQRPRHLVKLSHRVGQTDQVP